MSEIKGLKIVSLQAENVKRLKAVEITPEGHVQVIGGRNAQGKSSVLDSIWLALGGGPAAKGTSRPIRDGEKKATVRLDLGDLVVTRTWTPSGSTLKVENADGATYNSPQAMLDKLVGRLSFDPLGFTRLSPKEQAAELLGLVEIGLDLKAHDDEYIELFGIRTDTGRQAKELGAAHVDESLATEETSFGDLISAVMLAEDHARNIAEAKQGVQMAQDRVAEISQKIAELTSDLANWSSTVESRTATLAALPKPEDVTALKEKLATVEETNAKIRANNHERAKAQRIKKLDDEYKTFSNRLKTLEEKKAKALAAAKFPIDGLGFEAGGVTYSGIPFSQASSAEQIRVSLAIAMALNPRLKVLRIADGSLLDAESMTLISDLVAEKDYQLWIERVGTGDATAIIIEDGEILNA